MRPGLVPQLAPCVVSHNLALGGAQIAVLRMIQCLPDWVRERTTLYSQSDDMPLLDAATKSGFSVGNVKPGNEVEIVLDVMPGEVLKGRVRSVGTGVSAGGKPAQPGVLPEVENSRDWLRQAQRFPVAVEFDASARERLRAARIGGQADVLIYTGDHVLVNWLAGLFIRLMSYFSYLY